MANWDTWSLMTSLQSFGYECSSSQISRCGLAAGASYAHTTTLTVTESIGIKFKLGAIEVQPGISTSHSWSDTNTKVQVVNAECPMGGMRCGMTIQPTMCKVKGKLKKVFRNPQWAQECPKELDEKDRNFESEAVCKRKNTKGELLDSVIHGQICVVACRRDNRCDLNKANYLKPCPGVTQAFPFCEYSDEIGKGKRISGIIGCREPPTPQNVYDHWVKSNNAMVVGMSKDEFLTLWMGGPDADALYPELQKRNPVLQHLTYINVRVFMGVMLEELYKTAPINKEKPAARGTGVEPPMIDTVPAVAFVDVAP